MKASIESGRAADAVAGENEGDASRGRGFVDGKGTKTNTPRGREAIEEQKGIERRWLWCRDQRREEEEKGTGRRLRWMAR